MDVLSELLSTISVTDATFVEAELKAPWSFLIPSPRAITEALMPQAKHLASCHVVTGGRCSMKLGEGPAVELAPGEVVVFPRGDPHVLSCASQRAPDALTAHDISKIFGGGETKPLHCGGGGSATRLVSGFFTCDAQLAAPMLGALPRAMRISLNDGARYGWLHSTVLHVAQESAHRRAGAVTMLTRFSELLLAEAARRHFAHASWRTAGRLGGLRDPHVATALAQMHDEPQRAWTVDALADAAGVARSTLAERFARCVGGSPMQYLKTLRLRLAADRLLAGKTSIGRIAEQAGYDSEAAFTRAFKREFGLPPATWRRMKVRMLP